MGKRGPKPKPTMLRLLEGNPGRLPINDPELEPSCDLPPRMPLSVEQDDIAHMEWRRVVAAMPPGLYSALDSAVLAMYALSWSLLHAAEEDIRANGLTITTKEGIKTNPAVAVWRNATTTLMQCADRLGLTPGARARLQIPKRDEKPQSKFAGLIK